MARSNCKNRSCKNRNCKNRSCKSQKCKRRTNKKRSRTRRFQGGCTSCMKGGGDVLPAANVIPLNNYNMDPNSVQIPTRLLPNFSGGKRRKLKGNKSMKGGSFSSSVSDFFLGNNASTNQPLTFGSTVSSALGTNILSGTPFVNPSTLAQPSGNMFSKDTPPLV